MITSWDVALRPQNVKNYSNSAYFINTAAMYRKYLTLLFSIFLVSFITAENDFKSPCPRLFVYETESNQPGKWFGILTMISDTDARGAWVRIVFDRPPLELGNWYGDVNAVSAKVYFIINLEDELKAHVPKTIRFYVKYNETEPAPKLVSFRVNEKSVCPEERITGTTTVSLTLKTGSFKRKQPVPPIPAVVAATMKPEIVPIQKVPSSDEDGVFISDLYQFIKPQHTHQSDSDDKLCGTVVTRPRPLITYGQPTFEGEFPWHAAIYHLKGNDLAYVCGGSLVSKTFVITVAHCVTKVRTSMAVNPRNFVIYLGKHYLRRFSNPGIQDREISEIILHPQYSAHNYSNDIALLKLSMPVEYNDYVRPVCLWQESIDLDGIVKRLGNVVGWGFDETGTVTEQLMQAGMPVVPQHTCIYSFPEFYSRFSSETTYCAGFRNGTSVCNGDSGGGMVFPKSHTSARNPVWQLRGLVSISAALHNDFRCDASNYVVFTDIAKYLVWIKYNMMK